MSDVRARLQELADRDVYGGLSFGNMFRSILALPGEPEIIEEISSEETIPLSGGVPYTGRVSIADNDFWEMQSPEWKAANADLCKDGSLFRIVEVLSTSFVDAQNVKVSMQKLYVTFKDAIQDAE